MDQQPVTGGGDSRASGVPAAVIGVVVVAAGSGTRLGAPEPKAFVSLAGRSMLERSLATVLSLAEPVAIVVVAPHSHQGQARDVAQRIGGAARDHIAVVEGGATRQASVARGLAALPVGLEAVLVHDAARALQPAVVFERVIARVRESGAGVIPVMPVVDTIARRDGVGRVIGQIDRAELAAVQTPQGFPAEAYRAALEATLTEYTDDAGMFAAAGGAVVTVDGDSYGFKVTTPWDLRRAELLLDAERPRVRTGIGIDVHAYDERSPMWLGGVYWPNEPGLAGHSDGDAISHAICDALLSAAGLGDIGSRFGVDDTRFADARGAVFLSATLELVRAAGFEVVNVAVQVVARRPQFSPRRGEIEALLTGILGAPVSVTATTSDGLGFTGRGEGVTAVATALLSA